MSVRVLGLGNDLLADDRFGLAAAEELGRRFGAKVEVRFSAASGLDLLEDAEGASRLLVVDTLVTGRSEPGTLFELEEGDVEAAEGQSPHYAGLFEALALGRAVGLRMPDGVKILAVEAEDAFTVGGAMTSRVEASIRRTVERASEIVAAWLAGVPAGSRAGAEVDGTQAV
ncbi:MAG: hydrogenase maturation protease [Vicinamibacterales bacterium]